MEPSLAAAMATEHRVLQKGDTTKIRELFISNYRFCLGISSGPGVALGLPVPWEFRVVQHVVQIRNNTW